MITLFALNYRPRSSFIDFRPGGELGVSQVSGASLIAAIELRFGLPGRGVGRAAPQSSKWNERACHLVCSEDRVGTALLR